MRFPFVHGLHHRINLILTSSLKHFLRAYICSWMVSDDLTFGPPLFNCLRSLFRTTVNGFGPFAHCIHILLHLACKRVHNYIRRLTVVSGVPRHLAFNFYDAEISLMAGIQRSVCFLFLTKSSSRRPVVVSKAWDCNLWFLFVCNLRERRPTENMCGFQSIFSFVEV